jgi:hypothetical protein
MPYLTNHVILTQMAPHMALTKSQDFVWLHMYTWPAMRKGTINFGTFCEYQ